MTDEKKCGIYCRGVRCTAVPMFLLERDEPRGFAWVMTCLEHYEEGMDALGAEVLGEPAEGVMQTQSNMPGTRRPIEIAVTKLDWAHKGAKQ